MLEFAILSIIVFLIALVLFVEYTDDKRYWNTVDKKSIEPIEDILEEEKTPQEEPEPQVEELEPEAEEVEPDLEVEPEEVQPELVIEPQEELEEEPEVMVEEIEPEPEVEAPEETKELPECAYPPFTHVRLLEMGLSDDEAREFVNELIPQLEEQIALIDEAIGNADFHKIEKLTHGVKGSATNIGTGGVADLLTEFNTYLKSESDVDIVKAYQTHFIRYIEELKKQYT